jgi:hypothetical protein
VNRGRHEAACKICRHPQRADIEADFINWEPPYKIAEDYDLGDRTTIYRHAWALGLMEKRRRNVRAALENLIERGLSTAIEIPASATVQAIIALGKINANGQFIERTERVDLNALFERMSNEELKTYAETGALPDWFEQTVGKPATAENGTEVGNEL